MRKTNTLIWMATAIIVIALQAVQAPAAQAIIHDSSVILELQAKRNTLLVKEKDLARDFDELNRDLNDLKKRNDNSLNPRIDEVTRKINNKYDDLRQVRLDLRDVESRMI